MDSIKLYKQLISKGVMGAKGKAVFSLYGLESPVKDKSVFGNLIQEWLGVFMEKYNFKARRQDNSQEFPDFFMHPTSNMEDLLEVKCFTKSPNFDIANFQAYARSLLENAYRLDANYLIFEYEIVSNEITIKHIWIKKIWEISSASERSTVKIQ